MIQKLSGAPSVRAPEFVQENIWEDAREEKCEQKVI
jgi:hypothetical protein